MHAGACWPRCGRRPACEVTTVFCLGNCALGPTAVVNGRLLGRATSSTSGRCRPRGWRHDRRLYVPADSAARSVGADDVAAGLAALLPDARVVRNGSRGMLWLEPLVEVATHAAASPTAR